MSSFHPTFKLLYRYLALTDLLIGVVIHRLCAIDRMSMVHEHRSLCWYVLGLSYVAAFALCGVPLLTMTVISLNRILALLLGLRYKQTLTLKRTYITVVVFWIESFIAVFTFILDHQTNHVDEPNSYIVVPSDLIRFLHKDFPSSPTSTRLSTRACSTTAKPTRRIEHSAIQKGSHHSALWV